MPTLYQEARAALRDLQLRPRKSLGQNFLVREGVVESILRLLDLSGQDEVVEIGPGLGFLTRRLVDRAAQVWAVELDAALAARLRESPLGSDPKFHLIQGDVLKVPLDELLPPRKVKVVGNLPYSISTPVFFRLLELREHFSTLVLMVQKEVADRIASAPGSKAYGTLSVWCQLNGRIVEKIAVGPEAFFPQPKVRSTILKLELFPEALLTAEDISSLRALVRAAFGQRRKTFGNALASWLKRDRSGIDDFLRSRGIDPGRRGETLSAAEFVHLARALPRSAARPAQN